MRYWLVRPGWSTSWTALANMAERVSRGVNTDWTRDTVLIIIMGVIIKTGGLTSRAGVQSRAFIDRVTSAAWVLL